MQEHVAIPESDGSARPASERRLARVIAISVGFLLLAAAVLKGDELAFGAVPDGPHSFSRLLVIVTVEIEIALGVWLISGRFVGGAWATAAVLFAIMASANLYWAVTGRASCGCLGRLQTPPWLMFSVDIAIVGALAFVRPQRIVQRSPSKGACRIE